MHRTKVLQNHYEIKNLKIEISLSLKVSIATVRLQMDCKKLSGHFKYLVMPDGLVNAPSVFQRISESMSYTDDVLI